MDVASLKSWQNQILAVPALIQKAFTEAASRLQEKKNIVTTTVAVRRGTLNNEAELQNWISEHEQKLKEAIVKGPVIVQ